MSRALSINDIPYDRWITRLELRNKTGLCDRTIRDQINELRKNPRTIIISSSHGKGYKRPTSIEELQECLWESRSRSNDEMEKQKALEAAIRDMRSRGQGQQLLFEF